MPNESTRNYVKASLRPWPLGGQNARRAVRAASLAVMSRSISPLCLSRRPLVHTLVRTAIRVISIWHTFRRIARAASLLTDLVTFFLAEIEIEKRRAHTEGGAQISEKEEENVTKLEKEITGLVGTNAYCARAHQLILKGH